MQFEFIGTERLLLRKITPDVYTYVFENLPEAEIISFLGIDSPAMHDREYRKYKYGLRTFNRDLLTFQLIDRASEKMIGWCGFHTWYLEHDRAELGYALSDDAFKNKGLMSEALVPVLHYGFHTMHLQRIEAFVGPNNTPSLKLMEKFGFTKEGHMRQHFRRDDKTEDSLIFSLLKNEYRD